MSVSEQRKELLALEKNGLIKPEDVVEFAKNPETALHAAFTWDDSKCGIAYRLYQARQLIRVRIQMIDVPQGERDPKLVRVREFVSLPTDRQVPGGGYRTTQAVLSDTKLREIMIDQALEDFQRLRIKYETLSELAGVFAEIDRLAAKKPKKQQPPKGASATP